MQISPLQLKDYRFSEIVLQAHPDGQAVAPENIRTKITGSESPDDPHSLIAQLTISWERTEEANLAYSGNFTIAGVFQVAEEVNMPERLDIMRVNAVSLLYGAIREMVLNMSSRCAAGPLLLPTVSFVDLPGEIREAEVEGRDAEQADVSVSGK
jgi:preprotein translocase subunit SecB